jgi:chloride channel, nucleotide-sensitive, 1A
MFLLLIQTQCYHSPSTKMFAPPRPTMREGCERQADGAAIPELDVDEYVLHTAPRVTMAFTTETTEGVGTLVVTSARICWLGEAGNDFEFDVPYICLHALAKDTATYPVPCLYCQLDEEEELKELFFAPEDEAALQPLFDAFSQAAELNPDEPEPGEQEGDDELIYNEEAVSLGARQAALLAHLDSILVVEDGAAEVEAGQFEDADADYDEEEEQQNYAEAADIAENGHE